MDDIEKFFRKVSAKERQKLIDWIDILLKDPSQLKGKKLAGSNFYRAKKGRYRFIYYYDHNGEVQLESVRLRDEKTYRDY